MAFDLSGLSAYVDQMKFDLISQAIAGAETIKMIDVQTGIKHKANLNYLDTDIVMQAGGNCNTTPSGTTSLTKKEIAVYPIAINEDLCLDEMETLWTGMKQPAGSYAEDFFFHNAYADLKVKKLQLENELLIWQGDRTPASPAPSNTNLLRIDGFITLLNDQGGYVDGNPTGITTGTGITASNIRGIVDGIVNLIPENIAYRNDLVIFCDLTTYRLYTQALRTANLYNNAGENGAMECFIQGTNVKLKAVAGLNGTKKLVCTYPSNLVAGMDMTSDSDAFKMFFSEYDEKFKARIHYKLGAQIRFTSDVVYFKLA